MQLDRRHVAKIGLLLGIVTLFCATGCIFGVGNDDNGSKRGDAGHATDASVVQVSPDAGREDVVRAVLTQVRWVGLLELNEDRLDNPLAGLVTFVDFGEVSGNKLANIRVGPVNVTSNWSVKKPASSEVFHVVVTNFTVQNCVNPSKYADSCGWGKVVAGLYFGNAKGLRLRFHPDQGRPTWLDGRFVFADNTKAPLFLGRTSTTSMEPLDLEGTWTGEVVDAKRKTRRKIEVEEAMNSIRMTTYLDRPGPPEKFEYDTEGYVLTFGVDDRAYWGMKTIDDVPLIGGRIRTNEPGTPAELLHPEEQEKYSETQK